jgi:quercetin dioxygenase-like cupin family protein
MTQMTRKNLATPEETRPFADGRGHLDLVTIADAAIGRAVFAPGWQWSKHVKPIAQTDSCQAPHFGYVVSGRMTIQMNDGEEMSVEPGDVLSIPPGHDAWVIGDEPCVMLDWAGYANYAKRASGHVDVRESNQTRTTG